MNYEPAFFELFLGLIVIMVWARFVLNRGGPPAARLVPWGVGIALFGGQILAIYGVLTSLGPTSNLTIVRIGRNASLASLALGAVILLVMTGMAFTGTGRAPDQEGGA